MKIFIIGSGTFGTAIANELSRHIDNEVVILSRSKEKKDEINNLHTNKKYFPDNILNDSLFCSNDFSEIRSADIIFIALPSSVLPIVVKSFSSYVSENQIIVNLSKGISTFTGIHGYQDTVIPDLERAILSGHNINLLGLRGQAKTKIARQLTNLLDEWIPIVSGSEINDDPLNPISFFGKKLVAEMGDNTPIDWVHRNDRFYESACENM